MAGVPPFSIPADGAPTAPPALPATHLYAVHVTEAAQRYGIPEGWIRAVMRAESGGDPRAVSRAGAMGLMQVMPATWTAMTLRYALGSDPFDPRANIFAGTAYLRGMFDRFGDPATALAAYNAGPHRADDWLSRRRPLPAETIAYVARIAPAIGISGIAMGSYSAADLPGDWRTAVLFTARFSLASEAFPTPIAAPPTEDPAGARTTNPLRPRERASGDRTTAGSPKPGLFVALSGPRS